MTWRRYGSFVVIEHAIAHLTERPTVAYAESRPDGVALRDHAGELVDVRRRSLKMFYVVKAEAMPPVGSIELGAQLRIVSPRARFDAEGDATHVLLDRVVSAFLGRSAVGGQLVSASADVVDVHIVQPDIIFSDGRALVFIEMKVDSCSSIDQFVKYAIAAHCICRDSPNIESVDLVMLSRDGTHLQLWKKAKTLGLTDTAAVRKVALRGLKEDMDVWGEAGVPSFLEKNPGVTAALSQQVSSMGLHLADYRSLQTTLQEYATEEKTVSRLIEGVLWEFARRGLT